RFHRQPNLIGGPAAVPQPRNQPPVCVLGVYCVDKASVLDDFPAAQGEEVEGIHHGTSLEPRVIQSLDRGGRLLLDGGCLRSASSSHRAAGSRDRRSSSSCQSRRLRPCSRALRQSIPVIAQPSKASGIGRRWPWSQPRTRFVAARLRGGERRCPALLSLMRSARRSGGALGLARPWRPRWLW